MDSQETRVNGSPAVVWSLTRDDAGRIVAKTETVAGETVDYGYTYDALGHLLSVARDGFVVEQYGYDLSGTRTSETNTLRGTDGRSFSYSDEDHLLSAGNAVYSYNLDGYLASKTAAGQVTTYSYSSRGELIEVHLPDGRIITGGAKVQGAVACGKSLPGYQIAAGYPPHFPQKRCHNPGPCILQLLGTGASQGA